MDKISSQSSKKGLFAALAGTVLVALCCFTPILVILFGLLVWMRRHARKNSIRRMFETE